MKQPQQSKSVQKLTQQQNMTQRQVPQPQLKTNLQKQQSQTVIVDKKPAQKLKM